MYSYDPSMQLNAGGINGQLKNNNREIYYFSKAHNLRPDSSSTHNLAIAYLRKDEPEKALYYFNFMFQKLQLKIGEEGIKLLDPILKLKKELAENEKSPKVLYEISEQYRMINLTENAKKYRDLAIKYQN